MSTRERWLEGKRVMLTRSSEQAGQWRPRLEALGAQVLELPLITVQRAVDEQRLREVFDTLATYEWMVFTSANGVRFFMELFLERFNDIRAIGPARMACVGKATAQVLEAYHLAVDLMPQEALAEALGEALVATGSLDSANVLVVTGNRNRELLPVILEEKGRAIVDTLGVYETCFADLEHSSVAREFREEGADVVLFSSASTAESFAAQAEHLQLEPSACVPKTCSIGPQTSAAMRAKGMPVDAEASVPSFENLLEALRVLLWE